MTPTFSLVVKPFCFQFVSHFMQLTIKSAARVTYRAKYFVSKDKHSVFAKETTQKLQETSTRSFSIIKATM